MKVNKLYKGDKVVMHVCTEAHSRENVVLEYMKIKDEVEC